MPRTIPCPGRSAQPLPARLVAVALMLDNFGVTRIVRDNEVRSSAVEFSKSFYSPHEVAAMASVHPSTILNYIASGHLYAVKLSERTYRIPVRAVIGLLEPEGLSRSSMTVQPNADIESEVSGEPTGQAISA